MRRSERLYIFEFTIRGLRKSEAGQAAPRITYVIVLKAVFVMGEADSRRTTEASAAGCAGSPRALSELIGSIYDCVLDPDRWDQTLRDLRDALDCHTGALALVDLRQDGC